MGIYGLAWGVVIGAGLYLLLQLPSLFKLKTEHPSTSLRTGRSLVTDYFSFDSNVRHVLLLMGPRLLGVAVVQLNFWVNISLASEMTFGSVSGLTYGFSLMLMAQAAIAQSVAIAAMPTFSAQHALGQRDEMRTSLAASLRGVIFLALPASLGLMLLRVPLVSTLYQRGEFTAQSTELVAWALLWYAAGLVGHSIMEVLTRAFYAQHDTKTPVIIGTVAMLLNVVFSIAFSTSLRADRLAPAGWTGSRQFAGNRAGSGRVIYCHAETPGWDRGRVHRTRSRAGRGGRARDESHAWVVDSGWGWLEPLARRAGRCSSRGNRLWAGHARPARPGNPECDSVGNEKVE